MDVPDDASFVTVRPAFDPRRNDDNDSTEVEGLRARLAALTRGQECLDEEWRFGNSPAMQIVKATIDRVAPTDVTVLVSGESGVGKEIIPTLLHRATGRSSR